MKDLNKNKNQNKKNQSKLNKIEESGVPEWVTIVKSDCYIGVR
jgi:hypothetical protein